jgi:hypothetical protein
MFARNCWRKIHTIRYLNVPSDNVSKLRITTSVQFLCSSLYMEFIQAAWSLKMRSLTEQVYVDEVDNDEEGIAEILLDENTVANITRPGTSLKQPGTGQGVPSQGVRSEAVNFLLVFSFV